MITPPLSFIHSFMHSLVICVIHSAGASHHRPLAVVHPPTSEHQQQPQETETAPQFPPPHLQATTKEHHGDTHQELIVMTQ